MGITVESTEWLLTPLFPDRIVIWSSRRKTLGAGRRTNNKQNPHMTPRPGIEPGPHWFEASALTTVPSLLLTSLFYVQRNSISTEICIIGKVLHSVPDQISAAMFIQYSLGGNISAEFFCFLSFFEILH